MSTLKVTTLQNLSGTEVYTAKAWVNFNGTGTVAIRAAGNVSSITDNGTGDYTMNFTVALQDTNYCTICGGAGDATGEGAWNTVTTSPTTTSARLRAFTSGGSYQDQTAFLVAVFR